MIAFKNVIPANAQYTQSCLVSPAQTRTAAIAKNKIAVLRYQVGDALRCRCSTKNLNHKGHEGSQRKHAAFVVLVRVLCG